ncbi:MAG: RNA recognition motif domain-containing protein, partial [Planctomycetota bacterium]
GRSRGFAFVEMATSEDAQAAVGALNGVDLDGRALRVDEAHDRPRGGAGGDG